jgi:hypothetical protein
MYFWNVEIDCLTEENESFMAKFQVIASNGWEAIEKAKIKARKEGYITNWMYTAKEPRVSKI